MYSVIWPEFRDLLCVFLTAGVIKGLDDVLDQVRDEALGRENWTAWWGRSLSVYVVVAAVSATALNTTWAVALIGAAYFAGMLRHPGEHLPTHLAAWQESILVVVGLLWYFWGNPAILAAAILLMVAVQLVDDRIDHESSPKAWAGMRPWWLWVAFLAGASTAVQPALSLNVCAIYGLFVYWEHRIKMSGRHRSWKH